MNFSDLPPRDRTDVGLSAAWAAAALFAAIALLIGLDIVADARAGTQTGHLLTEALVMAKVADVGTRAGAEPLAL